MLKAILNWFLGTRVGNWIAAVFGILALVAGIYLRGLLKGHEDERVKQDRAALEALRGRKKVEDESDALSPADRRKRLSGWMSDDK